VKALLGLCAAVVLFEGFAIPQSNPIGTYGNGYLPSAQGVAVGSDGSSYVTDIVTKRVEKFSKAGTHLLGWGGVGGGPGQFTGPAGIAISPSGEIFVRLTRGAQALVRRAVVLD
jgi:DNA-binding beta-propeller fold protein YncE